MSYHRALYLDGFEDGAGVFLLAKFQLRGRFHHRETSHQPGQQIQGPRADSDLLETRAYFPELLRSQSSKGQGHRCLAVLRRRGSRISSLAKQLLLVLGRGPLIHTRVLSVLSLRSALVDPLWDVLILIPAVRAVRAEACVAVAYYNAGKGKG